MLSINTSPTELILLDSLNNSTFGLNKAIERLTTGYKINHAKDNAAGINIVTKLSTKISSLLQIKNNTEDGISLLSTAQGALEEIQDQLARLRELSTQAMNGTYDEQSKKAMQAEADAIIENIKQIRNNTEFNGLKLFESNIQNNNETSITANAVNRLSTSAKVKTMSARSAIAPAALSDDNLIAGAVDFKASETKTINIDGINYTVKNKESIAKTLSYTKDTTTDELTLYTNKFEIRGEENKTHNIKIIGSENNIYGGTLNDTIYITGTDASASRNNYIYGGDGDDILISDCRDQFIYGQGGNDNIIINSYNTIAYGGDGDDTFTVNAPSWSNSISLYGEGGEDNFYIKTDIASGYVDGGAGTNYAEVISPNKVTLINVPNANAQVIEFAKNETKSLNINGLDYTITNRKGTSSNFLYTINDDGAIEIKSQYFIIKGNENQKHNIKISTGFVYYYAGNMGDTINSTSSNNCIWGGNGNDNITIHSYTYVDAGEGDNTILIKYQQNIVTAGNGNNIVNIGSNTQCCSIELGDGNNTVHNAQRLNHSTFYGGSGKNTFADGTPIDSLITGFGSADNALAFSVPDKGSSILNVNGINYEVSKKNNTTHSKLLYNYNSITGQIEFGGSKFIIKGDKNTAHNVIIQGGHWSYFYGGNLDDTIVNNTYGAQVFGEGGDDTITSTMKGDCHLYGGDGNDIITAATAFVYGDAGDDIINITGGSTFYRVDGGAGNDTYNIGAAANVIDNYGNNIYNVNCNNTNVSGGSGNDTFYIKGDGNIILGAGGNDYIVIDGNNNTVDGGTGNNYYVDNGRNTTLTNVNKDPNSGILTFTYAGETKTFTMNGITYTVTNQNADGTAPASNQLSYSFNPNTGAITLNGSDFTVGSSSAANKLNIRGNNNTINGGHGADIITVEQGSNNIINGLGGNDTLIMNSENNALKGGDGDDIITLNASTDKAVTGGNGNDTININTSDNTNINSGNGDDKIIVKGENNIINASEGNNNISVNGANNEINAGNGNNKVVVTTDHNSITLGNGANSIGIQGNSNTLESEKASGDINIVGNNNDITVTDGNNNVNIKGNENSFISESGNKIVSIDGNTNNVQTGSGNDEFEIRGNNNIIGSASGDNEVNLRGDENTYQGGDGKDNITISGNKNQTNGGDASDEFMVSKGNGNIIDGETGDRNTMINNGVNTQFTNVVDITPRPFELGVKVDLGTSSNSFVNVSISFNLFDFYLDFTSDKGLGENIEKIDDLLSQVETQLMNISTSINRLTAAMEEQGIQLENMISTRSTLQDADITKESSNLIKYQILQQATATLFSTANQSPSIALQLI